MNPGDIVMYTFQDLRSLELVDRPAIITSKAVYGSCDSSCNLQVFFEPRDTPKCRPAFAEEETPYGTRRGIVFGAERIPETWHRRQA